MKGIEFSKAIPYVCEEERSLPKEQQTVFWLKSKTHSEANKTLSRYAAAGKDGRGGFRELNANKLDTADYSEWANIVVKIENFCFPLSFYEDHENEKKSAIKRGDDFYIKLIEEKDIWLIKEVLRCLPANVVNEIWDVAIDYSKLKEGEKKS